jgi:predicted lipoprotein with Yx(FWY)xxD motif
MNRPLIGSVLTICLTAISSANAAPPTSVTSTAKGLALADAKGMSLYAFDWDSGGKSACNVACAANWPRLMAKASDQASDQASENYTIITRDDGSKQWAYKGRPLYTFTKDQEAGDITGDGFLNGAWHLAQP